MGDMDEVDNVKQGKGESKEVAEADRSKLEENNITMIDQSSVVQTDGRRSPVGGNDIQENSGSPTEVALVNGETDEATRRGSAHSHRSRHSSGGSSSSKRSRSRHKSKHRDEDASRVRSNSRTRSSSAGKHRTKPSNRSKDMDTADPENETDDDAEISVVHVDSFTLDAHDKAPRVSSGKDRLHKQEKKIEKKLLHEKEKYAAEKQQLRAKMERARRKVQEEVGFTNQFHSNYSFY